MLKISRTTVYRYLQK
ncbi:hypothetical protein [Bacillus cereus]